MPDALPTDLPPDIRTGRQPVTGHDDPDGDLRVFAVQYRLDVDHVTSIDSYRRAMRALMDELVVPYIVPGRPTLVVYPELVGLPVVAIGPDGAGLRQLAGSTVEPPDNDAPLALLAGMSAIEEASESRIAAYVARFSQGDEDVDMRTVTYLAGTDNAARAFSQTFSAIATDYGVWVVAGNYQAPYTETRDPDEIAAFATPGDDVAYIATTPKITNATFLWGPDEIRTDAPLGERNLLARNEKVPLTDMESAMGIAEGPIDGEAARRNAGWTDVAGFRVGFATSLPAFEYGYPFGARPEGFDPFADVRSSYAAAQDSLGVDVMIQADANPGAWAAPVASGAWQPLEWMGSTWRAVADPTVRFRYNVTPMMTGNLLDLMFDGQSSITARDHRGRPGMHFVGNARPGPGDPADYDVYAGDKTEFLAVSPWLVDDAPRDELLALTRALSPGSRSELENGYIETAIYADLRRPATDED